VEPVTMEYMPAEHFTGCDIPCLSQYDPMGHIIQSDALTAPMIG